MGRRRQLCRSRRSDARDSGALTSRPSRGYCATHLPPGLAPRPHGPQACAQLRGSPLADRCPRRALHARRRRRAPRPHACHPPRRRLLGIQPRRRHRRPCRGHPMRGQRLAADDRRLRLRPAQIRRNSTPAARDGHARPGLVPDDPRGDAAPLHPELPDPRTAGGGAGRLLRVPGRAARTDGHASRLCARLPRRGQRTRAVRAPGENSPRPSDATSSSRARPRPSKLWGTTR